MPRSLAAPSRSVIVASIEEASEVVLEICVAISPPPNWVAVRETAPSNLLKPLFTLAVRFADSTFSCRQASCRAFRSAWACCGETWVVATAGALAALAGLAGGVFAWRYLSPMLIARLEKGLCLHSARIVAVDNLSVGET